jgi:NADH dehydrogenase [ubiquinone] 1 alpha subcomplex assembly factor 5
MLHRWFLPFLCNEVKPKFRRLDKKVKMRNSQKIFDNVTKSVQRSRALSTTDYLFNEVAIRMSDRLLDIKRRFPYVMDYCSRGNKFLKLPECEVNSKLIRFTTEDFPSVGDHILKDAEDLSSVAPCSFDAILTNMSLHWVNDLPGVFKQLNGILKPDGLFMGSLLGCSTLYELRCSFQLAEIERMGGIAPRVSPFAQPSDISGLLSSSNFT